MFAEEESSRVQINRISQSEAFRSSHILRHLLEFLADKSLAGAAEDLKEYSIGLDAFGKPSTYDPRHDPAVRIHVGRLRQKLMEYYQTEGADDPIVIDLPKGGFKVNWHPRPLKPSPQPIPLNQLNIAGRSSQLWLVATLLVVTGWAGYATFELRHSAVFRAQWSPELETLWKPFIASDLPLLVSISAPLFVEFPGYGEFRDATVNRPEDFPKSRTVAALQKAFDGVPAQPLLYFSTLGDANVTFQLGRLLASRKENVSIISGNELSWQQVSENNTIYVGSPKFFKQQLASTPAPTELYLEPRVGIHNSHPQENESPLYVDEYVQSHVSGIVYTLVSHNPGPFGHTEVMSFASRNGTAALGAVKWFTETGGARTLLNKIRKRSGEIPRYYQVLLKVRFQDGEPLETSYVLHRELMATGNK